MPTSEYEIDIPDELWEACCNATNLSDPSQIVDLALKELLDRHRRKHTKDASAP